MASLYYKQVRYNFGNRVNVEVRYFNGTPSIAMTISTFNPQDELEELVMWEDVDFGLFLHKCTAAITFDPVIMRNEGYGACSQEVLRTSPFITILVEGTNKVLFKLYGREHVNPAYKSVTLSGMQLAWLASVLREICREVNDPKPRVLEYYKF
jgi:hypothetical protein